MVFHDAYQYFEHRYGVKAVGAIAINPTLRPSAQRLDQIHERLQELDAACVFAEPQFEPALVDTVIEGTSARKGVLDPLGAALDAGPDQYFQLMNSLAASLAGLPGSRAVGLTPLPCAPNWAVLDGPDQPTGTRGEAALGPGAPPR